MECIDAINTFVACAVAGGWNPGLAQLVSLLIGVVLVATVPLITVIMLIWVERKFAARIQDRIGPNRVGPYGLLQSVADAVKMVTKEDITPLGADVILYNLAPIITFAGVVLIWAIVPFTPLHIGADLSIGILFFVAVGSISAVTVMIAGWSSNNKYALLGAFRTIALIVSYEVPMILSLLVPVLMAGSMSMQDIIRAQQGNPFILSAPLAFVIFFIANLAETGRSPFDLLEAESELIAGYNIEYSGFKFGMFMAAEFMHVFTVSILAAALFLGGWWGPFVEQVPILGFFYIGLKAALVYLFMLLIRNTVPRFRIDQVMGINWKFMVPLAIVMLLVQSFLVKLVGALGLVPAADAASNFLANIPQMLVLLVGNVIVGAIFMNILRTQGRRQRMADEAVRAVAAGD